MGKKKMLMRKFGSIAIVNNTFIGGVASVINTPALLAAKLQYYPSGAAFSENDIQNFTIVGDDIECYIGVDYLISGTSFRFGYPTKYIDLSGNCKALGKSGSSNFGLASNFKELYFPEVLYIRNDLYVFNRSELYYLYIPKCVEFGGTVGNDDLFINGLLNDPIVYAHPSMATINNEGLEGDLEYVVNQGGEVRFVTDTVNNPNPVTDLSVNTVYATVIKLDWSIPTSTNAIDYYEVYVDGVFYENTSINEILIRSLTNLQTYNFSVIAVDIFYNKSEMSNVVTQQINGVDVYKITDLTATTVYAAAIELDWSVPTSTNSIDYYEVYVDGVFYENSSTNEIIVTGLTNLQTYNFSVVAVDIFYNKSEMSNVVTQQINGVGREWLDNIISYYKFENNVLDSVGANNGVATDITYASGQVGNAAVFNGSTSLVSINNSLNLTEASFVCLIKVNLNTPTDTVKTGLASLNNSNFNSHYPYTDGNIYLDILTDTRQTIGAGILVDKTQWHTLIVTSNTATGVYKVYQASQLIYTGTVSDFLIKNIMTLGKSDGLYFLNGSMDDTSLLNKELSQSEVTEIDALLMAGFPLI